MNEEERRTWNTLKYSYDRGEIVRRNPDLLRHVILSKQLGRVTEPLAGAIIYMVERRARKPRYYTLTYNADMAGYAIMICINNILKFNEKKSENVYAYITTMQTGAFASYLSKERRQENIKKDLEELKANDCN